MSSALTNEPRLKVEPYPTLYRIRTEAMGSGKALTPECNGTARLGLYEVSVAALSERLSRTIPSPLFRLSTLSISDSRSVVLIGLVT